MGSLSAKLRGLAVTGGAGVAFWCPGCDSAHVIAVEGPKAWAWDRNVDAPTFSPSILVRVNWPPEDGGPEVCHSFVRAGIIEFLDDCTHAMKGQHVPLPDFPCAVEGLRRD